MKTLVIIGAGGFGAEVAWVAESVGGWDIAGYLEVDPKLVGGQLYGHKIFAEAHADSFKGREVWFQGAFGENALREKVAARYEQLGWKPATLIHPSVIQAKDVVVGEGTYVGAGSILSPGCRIGRHVLINQRVAIGHDAGLDDFSQACPGAQINGHCKLGRGALVGSNASIHPRKSVGDYSVVGANSLLIRNIGSRVSVLGVPAKQLSRTES